MRFPWIRGKVYCGKDFSVYFYFTTQKFIYFRFFTPKIWVVILFGIAMECVKYTSDEDVLKRYKIVWRLK